MKFAVIGVGGYVAPKHLQAIKDVGGEVVCALDPFDSVGVMDKYFKKAEFFTEFERFERHCEKLKREGQPIEYVSICSPNYLHDAHCRFAMRIGATPICEKPLVINPHNLDALQEFEKETGHVVYTILQLRYHSAILNIKKVIDEQNCTTNKNVVGLKYITPRGKWYTRSWKSDEEKSGGLLLNIGIHFMDMLIWLFGELKIKDIKKSLYTKDYLGLTLYNDNTEVDCFFSIDADSAPTRELTVNGDVVDFSAGFTDLHTKCYKDIVHQKAGYGINSIRPAIKLVDDVRKETALRG